MDKSKNNAGFTQIDIIVSIIILLLFVTLIASLFYNSYISSTTNNRNSQASIYLTQIFEAIDLIDYDKLEDTNEGIVNKINTMDEGKISAQYVENPSSENMLSTPYKTNVEIETIGDKQEDLVKIITITIKYNINQKEQKASAKRIKTRQLAYEDSLEIIPNLLEGMLPLNSEDNTQIITRYSSDWFDYSNKKTAQVTLQDVLSIDDVSRKNTNSRKYVSIYTKICI